MKKLQTSISPKTALGRWSVGLTIASILFYVLAEVIYGFAVPGPGQNLSLGRALTVAAGAISGAAFITGLVSIIKRKDLSLLVFIATGISLYFLIGTTASLTASLIGLPG